MSLQELVDQVRVLIEERRAHNDFGCGKLFIRPERALVDKEFSAVLYHEPCGVRLGYPGRVNFPLLEQGQGSGVICGHNLYIPTLVLWRQAILLQIVAQ